MNYVSNFAHKSHVLNYKKVFVIVHSASFETWAIEKSLVYIVANM